MSTITIDMPPELYQRLAEEARKAGKGPEDLGCELLKAALQPCDVAQPRTAREVLQTMGRTRPLGDALRRRIIPGVTLDEVRQALNHAEGDSLSDILAAQRGPKS